MSPEKQQLIGVRTAAAEKRAALHTIRAPGRVTADQNRVYRLNVSTDVWIRKLYPPTPGSMVRKNDPLLEFYTPNFYSAAAAYMYALNTRDRTMNADPNNTAQLGALNYQMRQAIESLQNLGVSDPEIKQMERTRQAPDLVTLRSPTDGYILTRTVELGQWAGSSTELYRIADLAHVWVFADVFDSDAAFIRRGQSATVLYQGRTFDASMSDILPQFDPATRRLKARFELDNPGYVFRPDVFVDVEIQVRLPEAVIVPVEAVVDSGLKKAVYVERADSVFEPRQVQTGLRFGESIVVSNGLEAGERIVVSGNFLLDSESRMKIAAGQSGPGQVRAATVAGRMVKDPVCGMDVDPTAATANKLDYGRRVYYFCSSACKEKFEQSPGSYTGARNKSTGVYSLGAKTSD